MQILADILRVVVLAAAGLAAWALVLLADRLGLR
jgi:hypothetical protein